MKKPKLAQTLKTFQKKQVEKAKQERRESNFELKKKNVESGGSGSGNNSNSSSKAKKPVEETTAQASASHVPCHIWTDGRLEMRTATPFHPLGQSVVLLCGEGDFSYCRALAKLLNGKNPEGSWFIVATALDSEATVKRKYRRAASNLEALTTEFGQKVVCLFGVDATKLHENKEIKRLLSARSSALSRIIFNFPHTGAGIKDRERNIVAQQRLLAGFFASVSKLILPGEMETSASLCNYQTTMIKSHIKLNETETKLAHSKKNDNDDDETALDDDSSNSSLAFSTQERFQCHVTLKTGDPYDAWNVKSIAAKASENKLSCPQSFRFLPALYAGYQHCRTIGEQREDLESKEVIDADGWNEFLAGKPAKTFVFEFKSKK